MHDAGQWDSSQSCASHQHPSVCKELEPGLGHKGENTGGSQKYMRSLLRSFVTVVGSSQNDWEMTQGWEMTQSWP